jgi:type 1 glutamine amidotransferase
VPELRQFRTLVTRGVLSVFWVLTSCSPPPQRVVLEDDGSAWDGGTPDSSSTDGGLAQLSILVFTKTTDFRHASIPSARLALSAMATRLGWSVTFTEDAADFSTSNLLRFQVVAFVSTTGDVLDGAQESAFEQFLRGGGGFVGVHSATDTEYDWPFYGSEVVGAYFGGHPAVQQAALQVSPIAHEATVHLPLSWVRTDEWYNFRTNPRVNAQVLLTVDESTYTGGTMGPDHPVAWCRSVGSGRAFYTALGHTESSWVESNFLQHLEGALRWASRR